MKKSVTITPEILAEIYQGTFSSIQYPDLQLRLKNTMQNYINQKTPQSNFFSYLYLQFKAKNINYILNFETNKTAEYANITSFFENRIQERIKDLPNNADILDNYKLIPDGLYKKFIQNTITEKERQKIIDNIYKLTEKNPEDKGFQEGLIECANFKIIAPVKDLQNALEIFKLELQSQKDELAAKQAKDNMPQKKVEKASGLKVWFKKKIQQFKSIFKGDNTVEKDDKKAVQQVNSTHKLNTTAKNFIAGLVNPMQVINDVKQNTKKTNEKITPATQKIIKEITHSPQIKEIEMVPLESSTPSYIQDKMNRSFDKILERHNKNFEDMEQKTNKKNDHQL